MSKINISIPQPCHENWQVMTPVEKGRFCGSCQKNVFDFTTSSDNQIIEAFKGKSTLCGRFIASQLNRDLVVSKEKSSLWLATTSAIISFLSIGNNEVSAQETVKTEQTDKKAITDNPSITLPNQEREISGVISDSTGPLANANVVIKGTTIGVQTDVDGKYAIKAKQGEILIFSSFGMESKELIVGESYNYNIKLAYGENLVEVVFGGYAIKKRSFFGRIFHKIGNICR